MPLVEPPPSVDPVRHLDGVRFLLWADWPDCLQNAERHDTRILLAAEPAWTVYRRHPILIPGEPKSCQQLPNACPPEKCPRQVLDSPVFPKRLVFGVFDRYSSRIV
jgi:hypothetical protein